MSVLVVGLSHFSAPVAVLEQAVVTGEALGKLLQDVRLSDNVAGSIVVSTCNRVEVYAEVDRFHGGVASVCELLTRHSGVSLRELSRSAYVHYEERAVQHLLEVACGLDSMVVGESQILGQVRQAIRLAREHGTLSRELAGLGSLALRTGRRAHSETSIDAAGQSLVSLGLELAAAELGQGAAAGLAQAAAEGTGLARGAAEGAALAGRSVLVVGAGSMSSLAAATAARLGAAPIVIANRTHSRAQRLASTVGGGAVRLSELPEAMASADLVITCTGAAGHVIGAETVGRVVRQRGAGRREPLVMLDLALPRDVDSAVATLPGVCLIDLETLGAVSHESHESQESHEGRIGPEAARDGQAGPKPPPHPSSRARAADLAAVRRIVADELAKYLQAGRAVKVAPTVVALRAKAASVVEAELVRLERRLGELDPQTRREIALSMGRVADKLLHGPTVRVKELVGSPGAESYESALRVLFELEPGTVHAVSELHVGSAATSGPEASQ